MQRNALRFMVITLVLTATSAALAESSRSMSIQPNLSLKTAAIVQGNNPMPPPIGGGGFPPIVL